MDRGGPVTAAAPRKLSHEQNWAFDCRGYVKVGAGCTVPLHAAGLCSTTSR
jgi:hypothetical protein